MRYFLLSYSAIVLGLAACSPEAATESGNADPALGASSAAAVAAGSWRTRAAYPTDVYELIGGMRPGNHAQFMP
jgi:hypothetical protein